MWGAPPLPPGSMDRSSRSPQGSEPALGHPFVSLDGKSHREVKTQKGFQDGGQGAEGGIVANLEVFDFHSTVESLEMSPSQTPALSSRRES